MVQARWSGQVVVSSMELNRVAAVLAGTAGGTGPTVERPDLGSYVAPTGELDQELCQIWASVLGLDQVGVTDDFFDLGGNSLLAVRMFGRLTQRFGVKMALATLFEAPTIAGLAHLLGPSVSTSPEDRYSCLVPIRSGGRRRALFCVHGKDGNVLNFKQLVDELDPDQPFYALQAFGLDGVSEPDHSIEAMAVRYMAEIVRVQPHGPYLLAGYSGGGIIVVEMAKQLRAAGEAVALIVLLDTFHPAIENRGSVQRAKLALGTFARRGPSYFARWLADRWRLGRARLHDDPEERPEVDLGAYFIAALANYRVGAVPVSTVLFRAGRRAVTYPHDLGWTASVTGAFEVIDTDGDHSTMFESPAVAQLADDLQRCLDRVP